MVIGAKFLIVGCQMIRDDSQQNKDSQSDSETDKEVVFLDGKNVINVINASKTRDEDVFKLLNDSSFLCLLLLFLLVLGVFGDTASWTDCLRELFSFDK